MRFMDSSPPIGDWMHLLSRRDLQELVIDFGDPYAVHRNIALDIFTWEKLTHLEFTWCNLKLPGPNFDGFVNLRSLGLHFFNVPDSDILEAFISSIPLLERLSLTNVKFSNMTISISAPKLKYFSINGEFEDIFLVNTPLLVAMSGGLIIPVFVFIAAGFIPLRVDNPGCRFTKFFGRVPLLETLKFESGLTKSSELKSDASSSARDLDLWWKECPQVHTFSKLKVIEMLNLACLPHEVEFARFMLRNSPALEKMHVSCHVGKEDVVNHMLTELVRASA